MTFVEVLKSAMQEELEKIAAGQARKGKRPISAHKLLEKDSTIGKVSVMEKLAPAKTKVAVTLMELMAGTAAVGVGAAGLSHVLKKRKLRQAAQAAAAAPPAEKTSGVNTAAALILTGAAGAHVLRKANEDRKIGRQYRLQSQQQ